MKSIVSRTCIVLLIIGSAPIGCRKAATVTSSNVDIEVAEFVNIRLRVSSEGVDLSKAKIVGSPTDSEIKEVAEVIGRIVVPSSDNVQYVRFTRRYDGTDVDFHCGHVTILMRKTTNVNKWIVLAKGGIF